MKIGRNEPCPCGSGKKFKKCHLGREDELILSEELARFPLEKSKKITSLPEVSHGSCEELMAPLDIKRLTGRDMGIRFIDLEQYQAALGSIGDQPSLKSREGPGSVVVNINKTKITDPKNIYIAVSEDIPQSVLVHQIAHVMDYLAGSGIIPGTMEALSYELDIPVEHLEHPREFGYWLDFLGKELDVEPDADDAIILYLYRNEMLIPGADILRMDKSALELKSSRMLRFLAEKRKEIDELIRDLPGYIGSQV